MTYSLIVSTHSYLLYIDLDHDWNINSYRVLNTGYHYGIALQNHESIEGKRTRIFVYRGGDSLSEQLNPEINIYNGKELSIEESIKLNCDWSDVHQITFNDGGLYISNTKFNSIVYKDINSNLENILHFNGKDFDFNHVNSIYPYNEKLLVLLHNKGRKESEIAVINHNENGLSVENKLSLWNLGCHNIFLDQGTLYYNASRKHKLMAVNLFENNKKREISFPGWHTKGLAAIDNYLVIGLSEHTIRENRSNAKGLLAVIDRKTHTEIARIDLTIPDMPNPVGNINEVRCISQQDLAHNPHPQLAIDWNSVSTISWYRIEYWILRFTAIILFPLRRLKAIIFGWK